MKITSFEIYRFELPLVRPLYLKKHLLKSRCGVVLRLEDDRGHLGYGEAVPFPGLHTENVENVISLSRKLEPFFAGKSFSPDFSILKIELQTIYNAVPIPSSLMFCIETALLNLISLNSGCPLYKSLSVSFNQSIKLNGLLTGTKEQILEETQSLVNNGYKTLKIKVGRKNLDQEIEIINTVLKRTAPQILLRLDANQSWTLGDALQFCQNIETDRIEYIEEPLLDSEEFPVFYRETRIPIALDETLAGKKPKDFLLFDGVQYFILKPNVLGGVFNTIEIAEWAKTQNIKIVISSAFESGIGLSMLAQLASVYAPENLAMGLDTYKWLKKDLLVKPFKAEQGIVKIDDTVKNSYYIRQNLLRRCE